MIIIIIVFVVVVIVVVYVAVVDRRNPFLSNFRVFANRLLTPLWSVIRYNTLGTTHRSASAVVSSLLLQFNIIPLYYVYSKWIIRVRCNAQ